MGLRTDPDLLRKVIGKFSDGQGLIQYKKAVRVLYTVEKTKREEGKEGGIEDITFQSENKSFDYNN